MKLYGGQELGSSRSAYSLKHQLKPNPDFNDISPNGKVTKNITFEGIEKIIKKMRTDWGVNQYFKFKFIFERTKLPSFFAGIIDM